MKVINTFRTAAGVFLCAGACWAQQYVISTVTGGAPPPTPTPAGATTEAVGSPQNVTTDSAGNFYFTSLHCVFEVNQLGVMTLVAGNSRAGYSGDGGPAVNAQLWKPVGLVVDGPGNLYIADSGNNRVRKVSTKGIIVTIAGNGMGGFSGDGGPAVAAELMAPGGLALDAAGDLYIADSGNNRVRKVSPNGIITTVAGTGTPGFSGDGGPAANAQLSAASVALDGSGDLFIADPANYRVREVFTNGIIRTAAGTGTQGYFGDGGPAAFAELSAVESVAVDGSGDLLIADTANNCVREVFTNGNIATVAGNGTAAFAGDFGPGASAQLWLPLGVAVDGSGNIFIADTSNYRVRKVFAAGGLIATAAGNGNIGVTGDGGPAATAPMFSPAGMAVDSLGDLFIADTSSYAVREVLASGTIITAAGSGTPGYSGDGGSAIATNARLSSVRDIAVDALGDIFIADTGNNRVREVDTNGNITTIAGNGTAGYSGDGGPATSASLASPNGIVLDGSGNIYISDGPNSVVRKLDAFRTITTIAGNGTSGFSGDGALAVNAQLNGPFGLAIDSSGDLFIADAGNNRVREVSAAGIMTTVAGNGTPGFSGDGGPAVNAQLQNPSGVAVDGSGNLYIADSGNNRVRKVSANGTIATIAGNGISLYSGDGGPGTTAELSAPDGVTVGKSGAIYVADTGNNAVRLLTPTNQVALIGAVVDAASESAVPVSPGKIVVIYGTGLGPSQLVVNQPVNGVFGQQLAGTVVSFRGVLAPLYYTSATQVSAIVPYELSGAATVPVEVSYQGQVSSAFTVPFAASSPSFFTYNATGAGQAAAINVVDGTVNTAANPVKIGAYISLYATGEGQTTPAGVDGRLGTLTPDKPNLAVTATVGGLPAVVQYAGGVYGDVAGLMQVNVQIPAGVTPGGYVPVVLTVGNASTVNGAVWIAVSN